MGREGNEKRGRGRGRGVGEERKNGKVSTQSKTELLTSYGSLRIGWFHVFTSFSNSQEGLVDHHHQASLRHHPRTGSYCMLKGREGREKDLAVSHKATECRSTPV